MDGIYYNEIKMQNYMKSPHIKVNQKRTIFRWRTRMEAFGENFRGGREFVMCPLCGTHRDNQQMSLQCTSVTKEINVEHSLDDILKDNTSQETVNLIEKKTKYRKNKLGLR